MKLPNDLTATSDTLAASYDGFLFDLDGVLYIGPDAVASAPHTLTSLREDFGGRLGFVTNNASRSVAKVAEHLTDLGISATPEEVISSAQVATQMLAEQLPPGSRVFVLGSPELARLVAEVGLVPTQNSDGEIAAVVQGYWPQLTWELISAGCAVLNRGAFWLATNLDYTIPTKTGVGPGNGAIVDMVSRVVGRKPDAVAGKPAQPMMRAAISRVGASRALMIGDRLDTDIEAANQVGLDSLLVLSGVTNPLELLDAPIELRPTYLAWDVSALLNPVPPIERHSEGLTVGTLTLLDGRLTKNHTEIQLAKVDSKTEQLEIIRLVIAGFWQGLITREQALALLTAK